MSTPTADSGVLADLKAAWELLDNFGAHDPAYDLRTARNRFAALVEACERFESADVTAYDGLANHVECRKTQTVGDYRALSKALAAVKS